MTALFGAAVLFGTMGAASAETWNQAHPARAEVNHRLAHENMRIRHDLRTGKITFHQARVMRHELRMIRANERLDARFDRGHITRPEDRALNQDENGVSRQIHRDAH
jgi:hypothetical protein